MFTTNNRSSLFSIRAALTTASLSLLPLCGVSAVRADDTMRSAAHSVSGTPCNLLSGFQFTAPANWRTEAMGNVVRLQPAGADANELYALNTDVIEGISNLDSPRLLAAMDAEVQQYLPFLTRVGSASTFRTGCGPALAFSYHNTGKEDRDALVLLTFSQGRAVLLLALAPSARLAAEQKALLTLFGSLKTMAESHPPISAGPADNSPLAQQWYGRLRNKKLVYMSSYSSGSSGGYSSQKEIRLSANGRFTYSSSSSVSIYVPGANGGSAGRNAGEGTWSIRTRNANAYLVMTENGKTGEIPLQYRDGKTFLNGTRFFVVDL